MHSNREGAKEMFDCCVDAHCRKSLLFGIMVLVVGLMLQNKYTVPDILVVIGIILVAKSLLMMAFRKEV